MSLEDDWSELVSPSDLNEKLRNQQTALWELIATEFAYIKTLKVIQDVSSFCIFMKQRSMEMKLPALLGKTGS